MLQVWLEDFLAKTKWATSVWVFLHYNSSCVNTMVAHGSTSSPQVGRVKVLTVPQVHTHRHTHWCFVVPLYTVNWILQGGEREFQNMGPVRDTPKIRDSSLSMARGFRGSQDCFPVCHFTGKGCDSICSLSHWNFVLKGQESHGKCLMPIYYSLKSFDGRHLQ